MHVEWDEMKRRPAPTSPGMASPSNRNMPQDIMQPELSERDVEWLLDAYADVLEQHGYNAIQVETIDLSGHPEWTEDMFRNAMRCAAGRIVLARTRCSFGSMQT